MTLFEFHAIGAVFNPLRLTTIHDHPSFTQGKQHMCNEHAKTTTPAFAAPRFVDLYKPASYYLMRRFGI